MLALLDGMRGERMAVNVERLREAMDEDFWSDTLSAMEWRQAARAVVDAPRVWLCADFPDSPFTWRASPIGTYDGDKCSVCDRAGAGCHWVALVPVEVE